MDMKGKGSELRDTSLKEDREKSISRKRASVQVGLTVQVCQGNKQQNEVHDNSLCGQVN